MSQFFLQKAKLSLHFAAENELAQSPAAPPRGQLESDVLHRQQRRGLHHRAEGFQAQDSARSHKNITVKDETLTKTKVLHF